MDLLLVFIVASVIGATLLARVIIWSTNRASHTAITSYFKASEFILEHHRPPPNWVIHAPKGWRGRRSVKPVSKADIIANLDDLIGFFEACSFFEDEWTREQMLKQLREERDSWRAALQV